MTNVVRVIDSARVVDEYGGVSPKAIVAIWGWGKNSKETGVARNGVGNYVVTADVEAITYNVSYYVSPETKAAGKRSRQLAFEDGNREFDNVFSVDMECREVLNALAVAGDPIENLLNAIEIDFLNKYPAE